MIMKCYSGRRLFLAGLLVGASPFAALAQDVAPASPGKSISAENDEIVVTGSLFRRTSSETSSPVTVLSSESLQRRGINNVADAVRSLAADNSGSIPTAFSGGFGQGAASVSLRGLSVNSTLVVIDGLRTVNYPLADDGQRSFVDLNTIPQSLIDRIEVLKDGASSTYGADAIGGVVNLIMKPHFKGLEVGGESGISARGDGGMYRGTLLAGFGDYEQEGWNVYLNAEYQHDNAIDIGDRGFPFNTADLSPIGGLNGDANMLVSGIPGTVAVVRRATQATPGNPFSGAVVPGAAFQVLNPAQCQAVGSIYTDPDGLGTACQENLNARFGMVQPRQTRYGFSGRASLRLGEDAEAYVSASYYESKVFSSFAPSTIRNRNPINTLEVVLPVRLTNGQLNPNNPFAAEGDAAKIYYTFGDIERSNSTTSRVLRGSAGVKGSFGEDWHYAVDVAGAKSDLDIDVRGALNVAGLVNAINSGSYNFVNPQLNSQAVRDALSPLVTTKATAKLYMAQGTITREVAQLPGGPLQIGIGGAVRRETLDQPNQNANRETLALNAYSASGKRTVSAAFFEIDAPILPKLELSASGRYDHYSSGFDSFSPKVGAKFSPIPQLAVRGTFSKGFRAPSFAESSQGEVIGYTTARPPQSVITEHGNNAYVQPYSIGYNSAANPDLKPEKSRSFTAGVIVEPAPWLSFTADYYNIRKTDVIQGGPLAGDAIAAYYAGEALPAGYSVTLDSADPQFPNATRKVLIVNAPYENASRLTTAGLDLSASVQFQIAENVRFSSSIEATHIFKYNFKPGAEVPTQHYAGNQGPYILSSGSGTPDWRGNWSSTLEVGKASLTATAYYTAGIKSVAEDQNGSGATSCEDALYTPDFCYSKSFVSVDLVGNYKVSEDVSVYFNVVNLFDRAPPLNPANYAGLNYNPTFSQAGIVGRFFRAGARVAF
jgi:iron complex outermembrane receptor protein